VGHWGGMRRHLEQGTAPFLGLVAALLFAWLASPNLEAQGPQYDELHQAVGAFTWLGAPPAPVFCLDFHGICVMNMTYSAAIKTNLYGAWLRASGRKFDLGDWRWSGILAIAGSLVLFAVLTRAALRPAALAVCLALIVTDGTLLLLGRFDWGPVALAFALRLGMLALWLRGESADPVSPANTFWLAALAGLGVFEKLSSAVVVPALVVLLLVSARRPTRRHALAFVVGLGGGLLPLALVNVGWLVRGGDIISLRGIAHSARTAPWDLWRETLALGHGGRAREMIFGLTSGRPQIFLEMGFLAVLILGIGLVAWMQHRAGTLRAAGAALVAYLVAGSALCALPRLTWAHHWLLATPFQYVAVALAVQALTLLAAKERVWRGAAVALICVLGAWLAVRTVGVASLARALRGSAVTENWDPSLARLGEFAADRADEALFVATGWGVGTQILCYGNGQSRLVEEPFWDDRGAEQLRGILHRSGKRTVYLVRLRSDSDANGLAARIEADLLKDPDWVAAPVEPETEAWKGAILRKFQARVGVAPRG
jgi:hypothetical protein